MAQKNINTQIFIIAVSYGSAFRIAESCNTFVNRIFPTVKCRRLPLITSMKKCWRLLLIAQTSKLNSVDGVASQFYFYLDPYHSNG